MIKIEILNLSGDVIAQSEGDFVNLVYDRQYRAISVE